MQKLWVQMFKHAEKVIGHEISKPNIIKEKEEAKQEFLRGGEWGAKIFLWGRGLHGCSVAEWLGYRT